MIKKAEGVANLARKAPIDNVSHINARNGNLPFHVNLSHDAVQLPGENGEKE